MSFYVNEKNVYKKASENNYVRFFICGQSFFHLAAAPTMHVWNKFEAPTATTKTTKTTKNELKYWSLCVFCFTEHFYFAYNVVYLFIISVIVIVCGISPRKTIKIALGYSNEKKCAYRFFIRYELFQ